MRAAIIRAHGEPPELGELDAPEGDGVVDVLAAAMNPVDVRIASGTFPNDRHDVPYVAGKEGVGRRADGSLVYFDASAEPYGAFAARTRLLPDRGAYPVPDGLDPALAVSLGVSGLAAWLGLEWRGRLAPGETVLVLGASGVVGQIALQAARLLGAGRVVAAARSERGLERARALSADATVQLEPYEGLADRLREASGGAGFELVLDPLWGEPAQASLPAMAPFGRFVNIGQSAGEAATLTSVVVRSKPVEIIGYTNYSASEERKAAAYERMARHALAGEIDVAIERFGLDDVPEVWRRQGSSPHVKQVVVP
jgi:NADPH2:quinone reductase